MIERTSVKQFGKGLKAGRYTFRVIGIPEKLDMGKFTKRVWKLLPDSDDASEPIQYHVVPWEAKELLLAVGGKLDKETDHIEWDDERVDGKEFTADLSYEVQEGSMNPKTGKPYTRMVLKNFEQEIAF